VRRGPEGLLGAVEERAHGGRVGDVRAHGHGAEAARGELCDELLGLARVGGVVDHDACAERGEVGGHLAANAPRPAGDDRDAAVERRRGGRRCCHGELLTDLLPAARSVRWRARWELRFACAVVRVCPCRVCVYCRRLGEFCGLARGPTLYRLSQVLGRHGSPQRRLGSFFFFIEYSGLAIDQFR